MREIPLSRYNFRWNLLLPIGFVILLFSWQMTAMIAAWLWFQEVGYTTVFSVRLMAQLQASVLFAAVFFCVLAGNLFLAVRFSRRSDVFLRGNVIQIPFAVMDDAKLNRLILLAALVCSLFAWMYGASQWDNLMRFIQGTSFGLSDPLFNRDISFYVFQLPFLKQVYGWAIALLMLTILATAGLYLIRGAFTFIPPTTFQSTANAQRHLFLLIAVLFFLAGAGFWLDLSDLLVVKRGVMHGAGYTDDVTTQVAVL